MLCAKFCWNWPKGSRKEEKNVKCWQKDRQTDNGQRAIRLEKLAWDELERWCSVLVDVLEMYGTTYLWRKSFVPEPLWMPPDSGIELEYNKIRKSKARKIPLQTESESRQPLSPSRKRDSETVKRTKKSRKRILIHVNLSFINFDHHDWSKINSKRIRQDRG